MLNASANGHTPSGRASALLNLNTLALPNVTTLPPAPLDLASNAGTLLRTSAPYLGLLDAVDTTSLLAPLPTASALSGSGIGGLALNVLPNLSAPADLFALLPLNAAGELLPSTLLDSLPGTGLPTLQGLPLATSLLDVTGTLDTVLGALPVSAASSSGLPNGAVGGLLPSTLNLPLLDTALVGQLVKSLGDLGDLGGLGGLGGAGGLLQALPADLPSSALDLGQPSAPAQASPAGVSAVANADTGGLGSLLSLASTATAGPTALVDSVVSQLQLLG